MSYPVVVAQRKAAGLCIDCGRTAYDPEAGRIKVRCTVCRASVARSRILVIRKGLCSMCRKAPHRPERTSCGPCGRQAQQHHKKFLLNRRQRACIATEPVVDFLSRAAVNNLPSAGGSD